MSTFSDRLREERKRLGFNQTELAELAGVQKRAQVNYEAGERHPDAAYLMAVATAGADVLYILTGSREGPVPESLTEEERALLADYREASGPVRRAARAALQSGSADAPRAMRTGPRITIGTLNGEQVVGHMTIHGDMHFGRATAEPPGPVSAPAKPKQK